MTEQPSGQDWVARGRVLSSQTRESARLSRTPLKAFGADEEPFDYRRSFVVPQGIEADKIAANLQNGVLRLSLPKPAAAKPWQIEIKSA